MKVISFQQFYHDRILSDIPISVSIGVFDGVHRGHQLLIQTICSKKDTLSAVITFEENPKAVLHGKNYPGDLTTRRQKLRLFAEYNLDYVIMIHFSNEFSMLTGEQFLTMIKDGGDVRHAVVGENFHCGRGGNFSSRAVEYFLTSHGINVDIIPSLLYDDIHTVSSSQIRRSVLAGDFHAVRRLMERAYSLDIADIPQYRREEAMYISKEHVIQPLPPPGSYPVRCIFQHSSEDDIVDIVIEEDHILIPASGFIEELVFEF